jgi:hypothetical protein
MRSFVLTGMLLLLTSCGPGATSFDKRLVTRSDVIAEKGEPLMEESIPVSQGKMMIYPGQEKFQLADEKVTHSFKDPKGSEGNLIFWQHRFKDCETVTRQLPQPQGSHTPPEIELACPALGTTIIYTEGSGAVSRIINYESK